MGFIDKKDWWTEIYAETLRPQDLIRLPECSYPTMTDEQKDKLRQTQIFPGEVVQALGTFAEFWLVRKYDQTLGWVPSNDLQPSPLQKFPLRTSPMISAEVCLSQWQGVPYVFGGIGPTGIDCSGFTQRFFWDVYGQQLPKNSWDQRKLGAEVAWEDLQHHDLIFCHGNGGIHHVVLCHQQDFWHARRKGGVVQQAREDFVKEFEIEAIRRLR